ncbi:MAG: DNA polymerase III subunit gamma/tau [Nitrospina sp.]|jgi:DNA polymerase III subunit gamma/tau|nr:DNA polymerase III subunit gamma/tau [Nitrospina sp.]MBT5631422.1 DNA polymerase III subunit gamma/tau [Nitrospina sp.]
MDFQVSARKWRPQKFSELVGQEHIVRTLSNSIELNRISHAFLFSGTRGVGKTTTARILARVLNCENGPTIDPCGTCSLCKEITAGNCIDVQEIDGASNNGVAEVRDLIDNVQYATSSARYKVYIIDEVHMLSKSAFNALLKTLEEPPPKVIFIFATTELIKIPETILSRCQCFEFKPLSNAQITKQLELICGQEEIQIDEKGLVEISKIGAGSMRDAQSLLDQVIAYSGKKVDTNSVEAVLGIVGGTTLELFADKLIKREPFELITLVQEVANQGKNLSLFCRSVMEYLRNLLMVKISRNPEILLNAHTCNLEVLKKQAEGFHADELQQMFTILSRAEVEMKRTTLGQMVFEMAILRLTETRPFKKIDDLIEKINQMEGEVQHTQPAKSAPQSDSGASPSNNQAIAAPENGSFDSSIWAKIRQEVSRKRPPFEHYLDKCQVLTLNEKEIHIMFSDNFTLEMVETQENVQFIKDIIRSVTGHEVQVILKVGEARPTPVTPLSEQKKKTINDEDQTRQKTESEIIQDALDIFGGTVVK